MNKNYQAGRRWEYLVKKDYTELGYVTLRTAGSHGLYDVVAIKMNEPPTFIQCKVVKTEAAAKLLIKKFEEAPPLKANRYFRQRLMVRVPGKLVWSTAA